MSSTVTYIILFIYYFHTSIIFYFQLNFLYSSCRSCVKFYGISGVKEASPVITRNIFHQCHRKFSHIPLSYIADINIHVKAICKCCYPCDLFITTRDNWFYLGKRSIILQQINLLSLSYRRIKSCFCLRFI